VECGNVHGSGEEKLVVELKALTVELGAPEKQQLKKLPEAVKRE
jgi:hypothetical protein